MFKQLALKVLMSLANEKSHIVEEVSCFALASGDVVFIDGLWVFWVSGHLERTLVHAYYRLDNTAGVNEYKTHSHVFLRKVRID